MTDPTTIATLAASAVAVLTPMLKKAAGKAFEKVGESAAGTLFEGLKKRFTHGSAKEALEDLVKHPADGDLQGMLRVQLKKAMEADPAFAAQVKEWVNKKSQPGGQTAIASDHSQAAVADNGSTVIQVQGSNNVVR
jgi:hypothetical protein